MRLIFCLHAHLPEGTPVGELRRAVDDAYLPVLRSLSSHPDVKFVLSYSGVLLESVLLETPEFRDRLGELIERGQVELLASPLYEPILPAVSERDRTGQIRAHQLLVEAEFGVRPRGLWIPERVWEPSLPLSLGQAGVEFVPLDDTPFLRIGLSERRLYDSYMTEDGGFPIRVFPSPRELRSLIPFARPEEVSAALTRRAATGAQVAVFADVAEKFGYWPGTKESVIDSGWLSRVFGLVGHGQDRLQTMTFSEYVDVFDAGGTAYLPTGATIELLEWSISPGAQRRHHDLRARLEREGEGMDRQLGMGFWRNFLVRYPEVNWMHKRGLMLETRLNELEAEGTDPDRVEEARRRLWRAQGHNAYWHGVTGGVYEPELRGRVHRHHIEAWRLMDRLEHGDDAPFHRVWHRDVDLDGHDEVVLENRQLAITVSPADGGTLTALDHKPSGVNVLNSMARREEAYHRAIREGRDGGRGGAIGVAPRGRSGNLARYLNYDPFPLFSARDHFLPPTMSLAALHDMRSLGAPPARTTMSWERTDDDGVSVFTTLRHGGRRFEWTKTLSLETDGARFRLGWRVRALDGWPDEVGWVATEWALAVPGGLASCRIEAGKGESAPEAEVDATDVGSIRVSDEAHGIAVTLESTPAPRMMRFPIETVTLSMARGAEPVFQGCRCFFLWPVPDGRRLEFEQVVSLAETPVPAGEAT